jgi:integrase
MACIRKRRGKWVADYRDAAGCRRWVTCQTRREAEDQLGRLLPATRQANQPAVDPDITLREYAERWLSLIAATVKRRTLASYKQTLDNHILPVFGSRKVRQLQKGRIKMFLAEKLTGGLARNSVRIIHATLRAMLNAAVDDQVILANPADKLGRQLRLVKSTTTRQEEIKAFTREQLALFLAAAWKKEPRFAPFFLLLARAGLRLGEALALEWQDVNFTAREIRVARAFSAGEIETPKAGHGRTVDMSQQLARTLNRLQTDRKSETLKRGWSEYPAWVFCSTTGTPMEERNVRRAFARVLKAAKLPGHFTPHGLRHTFASLLLQMGVSPAYVQRQLGHASIQLTVDTYGKWLPLGDKAAVDGLDDRGVGATRADRVVANGSSVVAESPSLKIVPAQGPDFIGGPRRTRTCDPLIKSQLLYQLS